MRRVLKIAAIVIGSLLLSAVLLIGGLFGYMRWQSHLPSDAKAKACFAAHRAELESLAQTVGSDSHIKFVNAQWIAEGSTAQDPAHIECARRLRKLGAQSLGHKGGYVQIFFWGSGCAVCHDSYKGFAYIADPSSDMPVDFKICTSLADSALPPGRYSTIEDGTYLVPIGDHWYLIRWECG
jgi:hypothetical protein